MLPVTPSPTPSSGASVISWLPADSALTAAYIAAIVAFVVFALDRAFSLYSQWRDRERAGVEMLTEGLATASLEMIKSGSVEDPEVIAELGIVGTRVQLRISRRRGTISALIKFALHAANKARNDDRYSDRAKLHIVTGLFALFSDQLFAWHRFRTTAGSIKRQMVDWVSAPRDQETGLSDAEEAELKR